MEESLMNELLFIIEHRWGVYLVVAVIFMLPLLVRGLIYSYQYAIDVRETCWWLVIDWGLMQLPAYWLYLVVTRVIIMQLPDVSGSFAANAMFLVVLLGLAAANYCLSLERHPAMPDVFNGVEPRKWPDR